jgi:hypothetical protein
MMGLVRFVLFAAAWGGVGFLVRHLVLAVREPAMRRNYATMFSEGPRTPLVEAALSNWRRRLGRSLWINVVAIPLVLAGVLIYVGQFAS